MHSPTIREDLSRLSQIELARRAERRRRLTTAPRGASTRRLSSAVLALLRRQSTTPREPSPYDSRALGDQPRSSLLVLGLSTTRRLSNH
jgi:hypothetical protein